MRSRGRAAAIFAPLILAAVLAGCGSNSTTTDTHLPKPDPPKSAAQQKKEDAEFDKAAGPQPVHYTNSDPEYLLAVIDGPDGGHPSDDQVAPYAKPVNELHRNCASPKMRIADYSVNAQKQLADQGKKRSNLYLTRQAAKASEAHAKGWKCDQYFAGILAVLANEP